MKKLRLLWLDFLAKINATKRLRWAVGSAHLNDTDLFKTKHAELFVSIHAKKFGLSEQGWMMALDLPNAKEILLNYVCRNYGTLPISVELKMFANPEMAEVVKAYISNQIISMPAEAAMLDLPNAKELTLLHIENQGFIVNITKKEMSNEKKLIEKVADAEVMEAFAERQSLDNSAMLAMFDSPKAFELACTYARYRPLSNAAQIKLMNTFSSKQILEWLKDNNFELCEEALGAMYNHQAHFVELIFEYCKKNRLPANIENLLFHIPHAKECLRCYVQKWQLHTENEPLLFKLPNKMELLKIYVEKYFVSDALLDKLFADPDMADILLTVVKKKNIQPKYQIMLFSKPNAAELLKAYIENNELCIEAQQKLLDMPKEDTAEIMRKYAEKHVFSAYLLQRLQVEAYLLQFVL